MDVPLCDLTRQYLALKGEIDAAMQAVAENGMYILGPNVAELEHEIAEYCQCQYAVGVNSGTDALHLTLLALDVGPGDEVITTPFTFIATCEAIRRVGAKPVFVDIDPRTYNLDPSLIASAITPRTKAILPVHLFGQPCDMHPLLETASTHCLAVVEDCAQAIGATYRGRNVGSLGTAGCLSFFPSKNLGCLGDGGMIVTNDRRVCERTEMLRRHGGKIKYYHDELGMNSRLDELQAAILRVKLKHLDTWNALRRQHAYTYNRLLSATSIDVPVEFAPDGVNVPTDAGAALQSPIRHVYHQYTIAVADRDRLARRLTESGIGCGIYYPVPLHLQKVNADLQYAAGSFPNAERVANRCLSLPMFPELRAAQQEQVATVLCQLRESNDQSKLAA
ncbi:MAG: DegT/DnrJ/EryC1/StrS family aminotransferase [Pirellulales bacterium]